MSLYVSGRILSELGAAISQLDKGVENGVTFDGVVKVYALDGDPVSFFVEYHDDEHYVLIDTGDDE